MEATLTGLCPLTHYLLSGKQQRKFYFLEGPVLMAIFTILVFARPNNPLFTILMDTQL
jgi:hypothetical protein